MTFEALEADVVRQRKLYRDNPADYRTEIIQGIRNRAALLERFFELGASVTVNHNEDVLPEGWDAQYAVAQQLHELARDIVVGARWLDECDPADEPETA